MKKSATYLLLAALTLLSAGCVRDRLDGGAQLPGDGDGVTLTLGLSVPDVRPAATRTIGDYEAADDKKAYLEDLQFYLFVFEDTGSPESNYLRELIYEPKISKKEATADGSSLELTATFDGTRENAIVHIVATADKTFEQQLRTVNDRSELGIFSGATGLCSFNSDQSDNPVNGAAYWRRVELNNPITNDPATKTAVEAKLRDVKLIRNFARVTVKVNSDVHILDNNEKIPFVLDAFVIVNSVDRGYVAAYNENVEYNPVIPTMPAAGSGDAAGAAEAELNENEYGFITKGFEHVVDEDNPRDTYYNYLTRDMRYIPARHPQAYRQYADDEYSWTAAFEASNDKGPKYLFERALSEDHKSFVVIKGHFDDQPDAFRYIKLDIGTIDRSNIDEETNAPFGVFENLHIVRNISYDITITHIASRSVGHGSAESAVISPPSNNIPTSVETRKMTEINDGVDRMEVNTTTIIIIDQEVVDENGVTQVDEDGNPLVEPSFEEGEDIIAWRYFTGHNTTDEKERSEMVKWNYPGYEFKFVDPTTGDRVEYPATGGVDPDGVIKSWGWIDGTRTGQTYTPRNSYSKTAADEAEKNGTEYNTYDNDSEVVSYTWFKQKTPPITDNGRGFKLEYNTPTDEVRTKTIRLYTPEGLTRDIYFVLRKRWEFVNTPFGDNQTREFNLEVYPDHYAYAADMDNNSRLLTVNSLADMRKNDLPGKVGLGLSQPLTLMFELPGDIPEALFPLQFTIEFDRQNVDNAYASDAVATTAESLFKETDTTKEPRQQYIKTITWDYYNGNSQPGNTGHKLVCVRFDTMATDAVETENKVRVYNKYFLLGDVTFTRGN